MGLLLPILALITVLVVYLWRTVFDYFYTLKRKIEFGQYISGPKPIPIIGNAHQFPLNSADVCDFMIELSQKTLAKGENVMRFWIGPRLTVLPLDGKAAKDIVESQIEIQKGPSYDFYTDWLGEAILLNHGEKWRMQRKLLTPTFHFRHLNGYFNAINNHSKTFVKKLETTYFDSSVTNDGKFINLHPPLTLFALNIVGCLFFFVFALVMVFYSIMGLDLSNQEEKIEHYEKAIKNFNHYAYLRFLNPLYRFRFFWYLFGKGFKNDKIVKTLKDMSGTVIKERIKLNSNSIGEEEIEKNKNFLDTLCDLQTEDKLSWNDVQELVDTFMFAACHPEIQERVYKEIMEYLPTEFDTIDLASDLNQFKYLDQCIKETLRLYAPVPIVERQLRNDLTIGGKVVPKGTTVSICPLIIHKNYQVYPNYDTYDPDNFLPERVSQRHPYDFIPFSAGPRNCIGQRFAQLLLKTFLIHFLWKFRITSDKPMKANRPRMETTLVPDLGLPITLHLRQH